MMTRGKLTYRIDFFDYWHTSSGLSAGTAANLTVIKDTKGLPVIKGRTLKGIIREAAEHVQYFNPNLISKEFLIEVFGESGNEEGGGKQKMVPADQAAIAFFTDAELSTGVASQISDQNSRHLFSAISSTAIDASGIAKEGSLRTMEVTIPLTLYADIIDFPEQWKGQLELCFQWIKRMGLNRHRGLGRCQFLIEN